MSKIGSVIVYLFLILQTFSLETAAELLNEHKQRDARNADPSTIKQRGTTIGNEFVTAARINSVNHPSSKRRSSPKRDERHVGLHPNSLFDDEKFVIGITSGVTIYKDEVFEKMPYTCGKSKIERSLGGLWWLNGLGTPEVVGNFGLGTWYEGKDACRHAINVHYTTNERKRGIIDDEDWIFPEGPVPCLGRYEMPVWSPYSWSFDLSRAGIAYGKYAVRNAGEVEMVCGGPSQLNDDSEDEITFCKLVIMSSGLLAQNSDLSLTSFYNANFENRFKKINENMWLRTQGHPSEDSYWEYYPKRIYDCDGNKVQPYWDEYMGRTKVILPSYENVKGDLKAPDKFIVLQKASK